MATFQSARLWIGALLLGSIGTGILLVLSIAKMVSRLLRTAVDVATRVAGGHLSTQIDVRSSDETGQLMHALKTERQSSAYCFPDQNRDGCDCHSVGTDSGGQSGFVRSYGRAGRFAGGNSVLNGRTDVDGQTECRQRAPGQSARGVDFGRGNRGRQRGRAGGRYHGRNQHFVKKFVDIISVIDGIAFQTNILALNAAVEAARGGEEGRSFAEVASDMRNLAQRSASAAKEIKDLIDDSVNKVGSGSRLVEQAGLTMKEVVNSVRRVTDIISEITAASVEQSESIEQVNQAITQMDQVTQRNAVPVAQSASAARSLQQQAAHLSGVVSVFKLDLAQRSIQGRPVQSIAYAPPRAAPTDVKAVPAMALPIKEEDDWERF